MNKVKSALMRSAAIVAEAPGEETPISIAPGKGAFLPASGTWQRYGVTSMTLHRWLADPELQFPRPFYLGRFRFWRIAELEAWEAKQPRVPKPFVPAKQVEAA
jgi:predicted DNA-binding transcriptional regulator AlpA